MWAIVADFREKANTETDKKSETVVQQKYDGQNGQIEEANFRQTTALGPY